MANYPFRLGFSDEKHFYILSFREKGNYLNYLGNKGMPKKRSNTKRLERAAGLKKHKEQERQKKLKKKEKKRAGLARFSK